MKLGDTDRLEAFSDGVMAVIITIMAFSIPTPEASHAAALRGLVPHVLVYVLSFVMVAIYWVNHHHLLRSAERISGSVMWSNLFLLFWLSLFPIVTAWVGRFPRAALPAVCYGLIGLGAGARLLAPGPHDHPDRRAGLGGRPVDRLGQEGLRVARCSTSWAPRWPTTPPGCPMPSTPRSPCSGSSPTGG